ncbi:THAP domain containing 12b [Festucalex cinctus]
MPNFCAAPNCTRKSTQSDLAFFRFPRDPERCRIWVENCRRADLEAKTADQLNKHYRLCAKHFDPALVYRTSPYRTVLKDTAIPTIFDLTSHLTNPRLKHRKQIKELTEEDLKRIKERRLASAAEKSQKDASADDQLADEPQMSPEEKQLREYLRSLFEVLLTLAKQRIPLETFQGLDGENVSNNYQALLEYRMHAGDQALRRRLGAAPVNGDLLSPAQLFQLLDVCENTVREELLMEAREGRFFSLLTDDLVDFGAGAGKHLPLFLRFVDQRNVLREEFLDFVSFDGDELALVERLEAQLTQRWGLAMEDCRGQAHQVTGAAATKMKAAAVLLMEKYPLALYTPCWRMALNVHLANSLPFPNVQVLMETLRRLDAFFQRAPAKALLDECIAAHYQKSEEKASALCQACDAGWTRRHNVFDVFLDVLPPLVACLDAVHRDAAFDAAAAAYSLAETLADFETVMTAVVLKSVLTFTRALGRNLQGETADAFGAANSLTAVMHSLVEVNDNIDVYHEFWYEEAVGLAAAMAVPVRVPRLFAQRQRAADDGGELPVDAYCREYVTLPVVHSVMQEVEEMFSEVNLKALKCLSLVPAIMGQMKFNTDEERSADTYRADLPNPDTLAAELHCWRIKWKHRGKEVPLPTTVRQTLQLPDIKFFPNVNAFLKVLSTLPVLAMEEGGDADAGGAGERLRAYLDTVPAKLWNRSLAVLSVNAHVKPDLDVMVDKYCRLYPEDEAELEAEPEEEEEAAAAK